MRSTGVRTPWQQLHYESISSENAVPHICTVQYCLYTRIVHNNQCYSDNSNGWPTIQLAAIQFGPCSLNLEATKG